MNKSEGYGRGVRKITKEDEDKLRSEIRKKFNDISSEDEEEMIRIAIEKGIKNLDALREELIEEKAKRERESKDKIFKSDSDLVRKSWSTYQKELQEIKNMNISEDKKRELRREAYKEHLRRIGSISGEGVRFTSEDIKNSNKTRSQEKSANVTDDFKLIEELKNIPEDEKIKLQMGAKKEEEESKVRTDGYIPPPDYSEDVKPLNKIIWRAKVMWPLHKLEPEEARIIRAIAWAKRRLDFIARTKNQEIVLKHKIRKMREYAERLGIKEAKEAVEEIRKEINDTEKEIEREKKRVLSLNQTSSTILETLTKELEEKNKKLEEAMRTYKELITKLEEYTSSDTTDLAVLKEILRGEVPRVLEEAKKMFHISSPYLIERLRNSLLDFANAEAAKMIETNYKTIYQSARYKLGFLVKEIYRPVGGPFASLYDSIGIVWRFIFDFIFSPIVIGTILLWLLFSIFIRYVITGPTLAVLIITIIITMLMILGQHWVKISGKIE